MGRKPLRGTTCSKREEGADVTPSRQETSRSVSLAAAGIGLERAAPAPGSGRGIFLCCSAPPHRSCEGKQGGHSGAFGAERRRAHLPV